MQLENRPERAKSKFSRLPTRIKIQPDPNPLRKPDWIRVKVPSIQAISKVSKLKALLHSHDLVTVCEEANCPNLLECYSKGTATFMIMGDTCTRRCTFCDVRHGRPAPLNPKEPQQLAKAVAQMRLNYVVITSVDRDDLKDGGAQHFVHCIQALRENNSQLSIEILVPDFLNKSARALDQLAQGLPDVFNHNIETVPRLYPTIRPGSKYFGSLRLIKDFKARFPKIPTKSGIMVGLGETDEEVMEVLNTLREHDCDMLTIGQYLQPTPHHTPVKRYPSLETFEKFKIHAESLGFKNVASGPMVRSSYHADQQSKGAVVQ